jgi:hypothetical protein
MCEKFFLEQFMRLFPKGLDSPLQKSSLAPAVLPDQMIRCKTGAVFNGRKPGKLQWASLRSCLCHMPPISPSRQPILARCPPDIRAPTWQLPMAWICRRLAGLSRHLGNMGFQAWEVELPWCLQPLGNWNTNPIIIYLYIYIYTLWWTNIAMENHHI